MHVVDDGDGGLAKELRVGDLGDKHAMFPSKTRNLTISKSVPLNMYGVCSGKCVKLRPNQDSQSRGDGGGSAGRKQFLAFPMQHLPFPFSLPPSLLDFGRKWMDGAQRRRKTPFQSMEVHGVHPKPDMEWNPCCLPSSMISALQNNSLCYHASCRYIAWLHYTI